jgi:N-acetylglutamate synthase-like GNAT family acetyltransferase
MIRYKVMNQSDIKLSDLDFFVRDQHTLRIKYVLYNEDGTLQSNQLFEKDIDFMDEWNDDRKRAICQYLKTVNGTVIYVYDNDKIIGFSNLEHRLYGDYMVMPFIHISKPYRNRFIAKELLYMIEEAALEHGAKKLYISAHPAVETFAFYQSVGCQLTHHIIKEMLDKEPADLQLEKVLSRATHTLTVHIDGYDDYIVTIYEGVNYSLSYVTQDFGDSIGASYIYLEYFTDEAMTQRINSFIATEDIELYADGIIDFD